MSDKHDFSPTRAINGHMFIRIFGIGNPTSCAYQFIIDHFNNYPVENFWLFIIYRLGIYLNLKSHIAHMLYV